MRTKTAPDSQATIERFRRIVRGPLRLVITDAVSYWLEDDVGTRLSTEATTSIEPLARVLEFTRSGADPEDMLLCVRLETGERCEVGSGPNLVDIAEAAAGVPARPRTVKS